MEHDDVQVGRVLSRREALGLIGVSSAAVLSGSSSLEASTGLPFRLPACIVRPSQTEGPYFVDTKLNRTDVRSDPTDGSVCEGATLDLAVQVSQLNASGCRPLAGALVDIWQCDAMGVYSGVKDINGFFDTVGKQFLRGHQVTGADGIARFETIYPGWYQGRTVHIHFKIRTDPSAESGHEFTSQLYFDDSLTDHVLAGQPYAKNEGERPRNPDDGIFRSGGDQLLLDVVEDGDGYAATFDIGLQID
jgi:protocatechuate 3,4-dioxygenase beta subunit